MQIEMDCACCHYNFPLQPNTPVGEVLDQMTAEGPWFDLCEGATVEDTLFAAFDSREQVLCPACGEPVPVSEESLGRLAMEMLTGW